MKEKNPDSLAAKDVLKQGDKTFYAIGISSRWQKACEVFE